jgi:hypothetical protein
VAGDLGQGEEHDVVRGAPGDGRVLRPVVHQVVDGPALAGAGWAQRGLADRAVGVVGRAHQLDFVVVPAAGEPVGVARPAEVARQLEVRLRRVRLAMAWIPQLTSVNHHERARINTFKKRIIPVPSPSSRARRRRRARACGPRGRPR